MFVADLSSQSEVRRLAGEVLDKLSRIDVLVNNVGGYWANAPHQRRRLERTFALNHLAPFLLTNLLLDRLKESARPAYCDKCACPQPRVVGQSWAGEGLFQEALSFPASVSGPVATQQ